METITAKDYAGILLIVPQNIMDFAYVNFCLSFFFFFLFLFAFGGTEIWIQGLTEPCL
jgi:hypothetical protein